MLRMLKNEWHTVVFPPCIVCLENLKARSRNESVSGHSLSCTIIQHRELWRDPGQPWPLEFSLVFCTSCSVVTLRSFYAWLSYLRKYAWLIVFWDFLSSFCHCAPSPLQIGELGIVTTMVLLQ